MLKNTSYIDKHAIPIIERRGIKGNYLSDIFYYLLKVNWTVFFLLFFITYLTINSGFATLYWLGGDSILNAMPGSYWDCWLFSFQTSTTIGYGSLLPKNIYAHTVVIFDSISGIMFVTICTGLAFARFSRPTSKIIFSENVLISNWHGKRTLMFRIGNGRNNQIMDASIMVCLLKTENSPEAGEFRKLHDLKLMRSATPIFGLTWTVFHEINEDSPLYNMSLKDISEDGMNLIISFNGIDTVFSQTVYGRYGYNADSFVEDKQFEDIISVEADGKKVMDYGKFHHLK